jgi:hypothetical protein
VSCGASRVDNELRRWGGSKLIAVTVYFRVAVNRVVSQTLAVELIGRAAYHLLKSICRFVERRTVLHSIAPNRNENVPPRENGVAADSKTLASPDLIIDSSGTPPEEITFTIATRRAVCHGLCADNRAASGV